MSTVTGLAPSTTTHPCDGPPAKVSGWRSVSATSEGAKSVASKSPRNAGSGVPAYPLRKRGGLIDAPGRRVARGDEQIAALFALSAEDGMKARRSEKKAGGFGRATSGGAPRRP